MKKLSGKVLMVVALVIVISACSKNPVATDKDTDKDTDTDKVPTAQAESAPVARPVPPEEPPPPTPARTAWTPKASFDYPAVPTGLPADLPPPQPLDKYVLLAWNDLGMHCYQADFSQFQILPPYNVFWTQVIERGEKPVVVTEGVELRYETLKVTDPAQHTNFWDYAAAYDWKLEPGTGLKGKRTAGTMEAATDHFVAEGVPVVDFNDDGTWDPFPMFAVSLRDNTGTLLAQTINVAPASSEMSCDLCHVGDSLQDSMAAILKAHDKNENTDLLQQAEAGKPIRCSSCHADPAMGAMVNQQCESSLSSAMHGFHADKVTEARPTETGRKLPKNLCQTCHPGPQTQCLRDVMSTSGVTCKDCHGPMEVVADRTRTPWVTMPTCKTCHTEDLDDPDKVRIDDPNTHLTADAASLYRNSRAHGGGGIYCPACHGSPHAVVPTGTVRDNEQAVRLQGRKGPINKCEVCHIEKPAGKFWHFSTAAAQPPAPTPDAAPVSTPRASTDP